MACLKNNILKEIDLDYARELKVKLDDIATQWEEQIRYIRFFAFCDESFELLKDIREDLKWILSIMKEEPVAYSDSLLETFYLKLSCHEMIGREKDLLDVSNSYSDEIPKVTDYQMEKYKELEADGLTINYNIKLDGGSEFLSYISEHKKLLAQCVFGRESIGKNDNRKIDRAVKWFKEYMLFVKSNTKASLLSQIPVRHFVSFLQEFVFLDKNEKIPNNFYRHKNIKTLNAEVFMGEDALRKNQFAWLAKVGRRYAANCGNSETDTVAKEVECLLDVLLLKVYESNSLYELEYMAWLIMAYIRTFVGNRESVQERGKVLLIMLQEKGYCLSVVEERMLRIFLGSLEEIQFHRFLIETMNGIVSAESKNKDVAYVYDYDVTTDSCMDGEVRGVLELEICPCRKELKIAEWGYQ